MGYSIVLVLHNLHSGKSTRNDSNMKHHFRLEAILPLKKRLCCYPSYENLYLQVRSNSGMSECCSFISYGALFPGPGSKSTKMRISSNSWESFCLGFSGKYVGFRLFWRGFLLQGELEVRYEAESNVIIPPNVYQDHIIQAAQRIIHTFPPPQKKMLNHVKPSSVFFWKYWSILSTCTKPLHLLHTTAKAERPESLDIMRKSKAKPIIPPAAHQCPRKAAIVGNGKQHILEAIFVNYNQQQLQVGSCWRNTDQVRMLVRQEMLEQCI